MIGRQQTVLFMFIITGSLDSIWSAVLPEPVAPEVAGIEPELLPVAQQHVTSTASPEPDIQEDHMTEKEPTMPVVMVTQSEITPEIQTNTALPNEPLTKSSEIEPLPTPVADTKPPSLPEELPTTQPEVLADVISDVNQTWHNDIKNGSISGGEPRYWPYYGGWFGYSPILMGGGGGGGGGGGIFGGGGGGGGGGRK